MLEWKSFHLSEYCCSLLDEDEEAAMASVPSGPTAEGTRGAIVLTLAPHEDTFTSPSRRVSPRTPLFFIDALLLLPHTTHRDSRRLSLCNYVNQTRAILRFRNLHSRLNEITVFFRALSVS